MTVIRDPEGLPPEWAGVMVGQEREVKGKNASTAHFYLTSLRLSAEELTGYIRGH